MTHRITTLLLFFSLLSLSLTGCDSSDGPDMNNPPGEGNASVTGAIISDFTGMALWTEFEDDETGDPYFAIMIFDGDNLMESTFSEIVVIGGNRTRPSNGTHPLGDYDGDQDDALVGAYMQPSADGTSFLMAISLTGTLTLNHHSGSNNLEGSFSFEGPAINTVGTPMGNATVSGAFNAIFIDLGTVPVAREFFDNHIDDIRMSLVD